MSSLFYRFIRNYWDDLPVGTFALDEERMVIGVAVRQTGPHVKKEGRALAKMRVEAEVGNTGRLRIVMPTFPHSKKRQKVWSSVLADTVCWVFYNKPKLMRHGYEVLTASFDDLKKLDLMREAVGEALPISCLHGVVGALAGGNVVTFTRIPEVYHVN